MIDPRLLRDDPDRVRAAQAKRGLSDDVVDRALAADSARRQAIADFESKRAEQKASGALVAQAQGEEKQALLAQVKELAAGVKEAEATRTAAEAEWDEAIRAIPNIADDAAPAGLEDDYTVIEHVGTPREFDFEPRDHVELGQLLGAIDLERGAKVSGSRFYFLTGIGAQLQLALVNMAMDQARAPASSRRRPPRWSRPRAMEGTGFLGQAADDVYRIEGEDLYLVGTSEVPMAAFHSDEILDAGALPLRYAAFSPCFRKEAGSHGKDTRGHLARALVRQGRDVRLHDRSRSPTPSTSGCWSGRRSSSTSSSSAYRIIDTAAGDLGLSAARKFDCEAWIPTRNGCGELTSTSNCTDYQARRLDIRTRGDGATTPVATLNGTLTAVTRAIVAILETHQNEDGSVTVPQALRPYLGGLDVMKPIDPLADDWQPRVVALDIDGTLLKWVDGQAEDYETITEPVHDAVHRALDAGAHIVLSSGRSPHGMTRIADLLAPPARGRRPALGGRVQRRGGVPLPADGGRARGDLRRRPGGRRGAGAPPRRPGRGRGARHRRLPRQPGLPRGRALRRAADHPRRRHRRRAGQPRDHPRPRRHRRRLHRAGRRSSDCTAPTTSSAGRPGWTCRPVGVSKASGLQHVCDTIGGLGAADVLAIGDGRNDIEMLRWAGRGVAMGQAVDEVKAAADYVTGLRPRRGRGVEMSRWFPAPGQP